MVQFSIFARNMSVSVSTMEFLCYFNDRCINGKPNSEPKKRLKTFSIFIRKIIHGEIDIVSVYASCITAISIFKIDSHASRNGISIMDASALLLAFFSSCWKNKKKKIIIAKQSIQEWHQNMHKLSIKNRRRTNHRFGVIEQLNCVSFAALKSEWDRQLALRLS